MRIGYSETLKTLSFGCDWFWEPPTHQSVLSSLLRHSNVGSESTCGWLATLLLFCLFRQTPVSTDCNFQTCHIQSKQSNLQCSSSEVLVPRIQLCVSLALEPWSMFIHGTLKYSTCLFDSTNVFFLFFFSVKWYPIAKLL